ncbi:MAG: hypothetical protein FWE33_01685 [Defluviitaleaceae bacterium]|nr:hypothetical protein [Defluviitaleaceae bacterium]
MKKRTFGEKYMHFVTKKPLFFYGFLIVGVGLFVWLTMTTHIETLDGMRSLFNIIFTQAGRGL